MKNNIAQFILTIYILFLLLILINGWSESRELKYFFNDGDSAVAKITRKTNIGELYFIEYFYHDNITEQGYKDFKKIPSKVWNTLSLDEEITIIYDKKKPTRNILITLNKYSIWWPFLRSFYFTLLCSLPLIVFVFLHFRNRGRKK